MDRNIVYPGSIPLDTDLLNTNRNAMVALGALISATLGTSTVIDGLAVTPTAPASMVVTVGPGSITQYTAVDTSGYGSLPADTTDPLMKMGVNLTPNAFTLAAPTASGTAVNYLIQVAFGEADVNPVVLPYYNAANPSVPYLGPNNTGAAQNTLREQRAQLQLKAGAAAIAGTQATPPVDAGWTGLAVITVIYSQTQITASSIAALPGAGSLPYRLPALRPGFSTIQAFGASGTFYVPAGVTQARVTVVGGGGAGGTNATQPGGGGGAGAQAVLYLSGLTPGQAIAVTVGTGGVPSAGPGNGGNGGTTSFGAFVSATGGGGGQGGAVSTSAGGFGGTAAGGALNFGGSWGTDGISVAGRGGDGGGPGGGRGTTGYLTGMSANGFGGGGGGGGAGGGVGATGGYGGPGYVTVEY